MIQEREGTEGTPQPEIQKTRLYECHVSLGARMVPFAGWEMPVWYSSIKEEHQAVREGAGVFDIGHMAIFTVSGHEALSYLQRTMTRDFSFMEVGEAAYSLICNHKGGVVDDVFVNRLGEGEYFVVANAANRKADHEWFNEQKKQGQHTDVRIEDVSEETHALALQGPRAQEVLQALTSFNLGSLSRHAVAEIHVAEEPILVARTGYTGEDGFELFFEGNAKRVWEEILRAGAQPIGLGARDSLRFEACLPLYGHELTLGTNPLEAGLEWAVGWGKSNFVGKYALQQIRQEGPRQKLVGIEMVDKGVPRHGYDVIVDDQKVGQVTSGMFSPSTERFLGLAYVPVYNSAPGTSLGVTIRGKVCGAQVVETPFYSRQ
jgi:aminomethyltransferase